MINIQDGVKFVFDCFDRMIGGEIFIPKIPSIKVTELASIAPNLEQKIIGIRPGEKLHEKMIGVDDAKNTYSFSDYYVIYPEINFRDKYSDQVKETNILGQKGNRVDEQFCYQSDSNSDFLNGEKIIEFLSKIEE